MMYELYFSYLSANHHYTCVRGDIEVPSPGSLHLFVQHLKIAVELLHRQDFIIQNSLVNKLADSITQQSLMVVSSV